MNRRIIELREVVTKLVPLLAGKKLLVTQIGKKAYVKTDAVTRRPVLVNIPMIPENADDGFIDAIQGFIDHEIGHVLCTDWNFYGGAPTPEQLKDPKVKAFMNTHNIVEDTMIEREIVVIFPGAEANIGKMRKLFIERITHPAVVASKSNPVEQFKYLLVPVMRALAGHTEFKDYMEDQKLWEQPLVKHLTDQLSDDYLTRLRKARNTEQTLQLAKELHEILYPPPPPGAKGAESGDMSEAFNDQDDEDQDPPPDESDEDDEQDGKSQDKPEKEAGEGDGDGERDHSESEGEEGDEEEADAKGAKPEDADPEDEEDEDIEDTEGAPGEEDGPAEADEDDEKKESGGGAGDDEDEDDEGEDPKDPEKQKGKGEDDAEDGDGGDDDDDGDTGSEDGDDSDEGDAGGSDADEEDDDADGAGGASEEDEEDGEDADGVGAGEADDDAEDEGSKGSDPGEDDGSLAENQEPDAPEDSDEENDGDNSVGTAPAKSMFDFEEDAFDQADMSSAVSDLMSKTVDGLLQDKSQYIPLTRELDRIEILHPPANMNDKWVPQMEDEVASMTAPMQKDIERIMASQSHVLYTPGHRKGKLHAPSLYRVTQGDPRVFRQKEEHVSKDTAVSLVVDNSGSMSGAKMKLAMISAFALANVLDRVKISNEVIGFTTGSASQSKVPALVREAIQEEYQTMWHRSGVRYDRSEPIVMPIYKDFNERMSPEIKKRMAYAMFAQNGLNGNIDGESIEYAAMRMLKRPEKRKVMLVLSDGLPAGGPLCQPHLRSVIKDCDEKYGIETVGIGIMSEEVKRFYPRYVIMRNLQELPGQIMKEIKRLLV